MGSLDHSEESLQLSITEVVYTIPEITYDQLLHRLFGTAASQLDDTSKTLKNYVRHHYINQLKGFVRHYGKNHIYEQLCKGSSEFIKQFEKCRKSRKIDEIFVDDRILKPRLEQLVNENAEKGIFAEFSRYYDSLVNRFVPPDAERQFRICLVEYFRSGLVTIKIRDELRDWHEKGAKLFLFKELAKKFNTNEIELENVVNSAKNIGTDEFLYHAKVSELLDKFLAPAKLEEIETKLMLKGRLIFLSEWKNTFEEKGKKREHEITTVEVYAVDCCTVDCNLTLPSTNIVISSTKVNVVKESAIDLSGEGFESRKTKAMEGRNCLERGADGTDGRAGNSSGNFLLFAKEMLSVGKLKVILNGGRGEDGGDGGDGYEGRDGVGVTEDELKKLCVDYSSLYFNYWSTFDNYYPDGDWSCTDYESSSDNQFIYKQYEDKQGRKITYSYAGHRWWLLRCYDLYFMLKGSDGESGTVGGSNGVGGEGGYRGTVRAENPDTGESFPILCERNTGSSGKNGEVGKSGRMGINGNDMVLIDRSTLKAAKDYKGSSDHKLSIEYEYEAAKENRLNGKQKHVDKKRGCFARFSTTRIDKTERRAEAPVKRTEATKRHSKAVAKQSIIAEEVISKSADLFEADDAFLAEDARVSHESVDNEEIAEESTEAVTEEVTILKQRDETAIQNYVPNRDKRPRTKWAKETFVQHVKQCGRFATASKCAQIMFDLFDIEIDDGLLNEIRFHTLFQKNYFRHSVVDNKLSLAVIAVLQDRLMNGKTYEEIINYAKDVARRRRRKYEIAQFRSKLDKFVEQFDEIVCDPDMRLNLDADHLYGVKPAKCPIPSEDVESAINKFFGDYDKYAVKPNVVLALHQFLTGVKERDVQLLESYHVDIDWTNDDAVRSHMKQYRAWFDEEKHRLEQNKKKKEKKEQEKKGKAEEMNKRMKEHSKSFNFEDEDDEEIPQKQKTETEMEFEKFLLAITKDLAHWTTLLNPVFELIKQDERLQIRLGKTPSIPAEKKWWLMRQYEKARGSAGADDACVDLAVYVIRLYWLTCRTLTFMRHLYNCNELFAIETTKEDQRTTQEDQKPIDDIQQTSGDSRESKKGGKGTRKGEKGTVKGELETTTMVSFKDDQKTTQSWTTYNVKGTYVDDGNDASFDHFLIRLQSRPLNLANETCETYMRQQGLVCAAVRYLMAHAMNTNILTYVKTGYQQLKNVELLNKRAENSLPLCIVNDQAYQVVADAEFRDLVQAQEAMVEQNDAKLEQEIGAQSAKNYRDPVVIQEFTKFFAKPFWDTIVQWVEGYLALTNDQLLLRLLHDRFYVDGCHLTPTELQFLLLSASKLQTINRCPNKFLFLLTSSVPQNQLVNVMLYLRILQLNQRRLKDKSKIYHGIQMIENASYKSLFATKLDEYDNPVDDEQMYKLILMLRHAYGESEQLQKIPLTEWMQIANEQRWSEVDFEIKKYGSVGYYLGVLHDRCRPDEEGRVKEVEMMREVFDRVTFIPESMIAFLVQLIATGEVRAKDDFFRLLKRYLTLGDDFQPVKEFTEKKPYLLTDEIDQAKFKIHVKKRADQSEFDALFPSEDRNIDEMVRLVAGLHDETDADRELHRNEFQRIGDILKVMDEAAKGKKKDTEELRETAKILMEYDDYLYEIKKKRLRHTQKMAILYAVESNANVLEQVNTGEGKSFIIAAMAVIRRKQGFQSVDIITSSPVLAQRDADEMRPLYAKFKLTVAHNCCEDLEERKKAYDCDIVYGDMARFQRDYLLHTFYKKPILGDRNRDAVIVDEVDNMLLDNGNNMLYLSHNVVGLNLLDSLLIYVHKQVNLPIFNGVKTDLEKMQASFDSKSIKIAILSDIFGRITIDDLRRLASRKMTNNSVKEAFEKLIKEGIIDEDGYLKIETEEIGSKISRMFSTDPVFLNRLEGNLRIVLGREREIRLPKCLSAFVRLHLDELIQNCKNAIFMSPDNEYVVDVDHTGVSGSLQPLVTIIDQNTGADLATSQWSGGLHQFLQLKHGCRVAPISLKAVFVSNVAYLKGYVKINGLSGTLGSFHESKTLKDLYGADLIKIPTFKPKNFYEHVPVIAKSTRDWIQSIFDEICDQVIVKRSVLIICESIAQLTTVHDGLRSRYEAIKEANRSSREINECFDAVTIYQREFQEFKFKAGSELECSRLIIATNLAGRGTDIKLCAKLAELGGLHVITAFLPVNCRIEEQAFGRAARCGEPGSGQIIAIKSSNDGIHQPSIFQLKMFRDNEEVHRLASLKAFYEFHTRTEEECLQKFKNHCSKALSSIYSSQGASLNADESLPRPDQVMYFALLDKWAMWLDEKSPLISKCAENHSEPEKKSIINSVKKFLKKHPIDVDTKKFETIPKWIDFPQSMITLGIIQMCHDDGFTAAEATFDRVLNDGVEFAAEVHYYKACMRMNNWSKARTTLESLKFTDTKPFESNIDFAVENFYKSRSLFVDRIIRLQREATIVAQYLNAKEPNHIKTKGFAEQVQSIVKTNELIVANIDWLLGIPCEPKMFIRDKVDETYGASVYKSFVRQGVISPQLIANHSLEKWQLERLRHSFKLSKEAVNKMINGMREDARTETYENCHVSDVRILSCHANLSSRLGFWSQLKKNGVFSKMVEKSDEKEQSEEQREEVGEQDKERKQKAPVFVDNIKRVLVVNPEYSSQIPNEMAAILKRIPEPDEDIMRDQLRLSNETDPSIMYDFDEISAKVKDDNLKNQIAELIDKGVFKEDWIAQINRNVLGTIGFTDDFEGVTTDDLAAFFEISSISAAWILDTLCEVNVLKRQTLHMHRLTLNYEVWKAKVGVHLERKEKPEKKKKKREEKSDKTEKSNLERKAEKQEIQVVEKLGKKQKKSGMENENSTARLEKSEKNQDKVFAGKNAENEDNSAKHGTKLIAKYASNLDLIRKLPNLKNVTTAMIKTMCRIGDSATLLSFYKLLQDEGIIEDYKYTKFRLFGKLDCSCLPPSIAKQVDDFLSDRFAYSFALEHICQSLDESLVDPRTPKKIFLSENPQKQLYDELLQLGILLPSRIFTDDHNHLEVEDYDYFDDVLKGVINEHRLKLMDQADFHLELVPLAKYFQAQGHALDSDSRAAIENGLKMVITKKEAGVGWSLMSAVADGASWVGKKVWSRVKAVGNFFYWIGSGIASWAAPYVDKAINTFDNAVESSIAFGRQVKEKVTEIVKQISENEIVKMAIEPVKEVVGTVGGAVVELGQRAVEGAIEVAGAVKDAAVMVADQTGITGAGRFVAETAVAAGQAVTGTAVACASAIGGVASAAGQYIAESKAYRLAKEAFVSSMNFAKNCYKKMATFVTAVAESYQYYNQCRTTAKRLALENRGLVDEHMLLRSFDSCIASQNRGEQLDQCFENNMREYLASLVNYWLLDVNQLASAPLQKQFQDAIQIDEKLFAEVMAENCQAMSQLKAALSEHFLVLANVTKIVFYQLIKQFSAHPSLHLASLPLADLPLGAIQCNFDRLDESLKITCEEVQKSLEAKKDNLEISETTETVKTDLSALLKAQIETLTKSLANSIVVDPSVRVITAYLSHCREKPQLATMADFQKEDTEVKKALAGLNAVIQSKRNVEFLKQEMNGLVYELLHRRPENQALLRFAVSYGLPLPLSTVTPISIAVHKMVTTVSQYSAGLVVRVFDEEANFETDRPLFSMATKEGAKRKMNLRYVRRMLFVSQADYFSYVSLNDESLSTDNLPAAAMFYEALMTALPFTKKFFPKRHDSFREMLIDQI